MSNSASLQEPIELSVTMERFCVPSEFASPYSELILTAGPGPCLLLFRPEQWYPISDKLLSFPLERDPASRPEINTLRRILVGNHRSIEVSSRNYIQIDQELADFADIRRSLLWVHRPRAVELWNPSKYDPKNRLNIFANND